MRSGKGGPVMVEVPNEIFEAEFKGEIDYTPVPVQRTAPDPDAIKEAARMLLAAKNPILWAGQGIHYAEAGDRLAALAELLPAPVVTTNPGKSAIPDAHPLALGGSTRSRSKMYAEFMAKADVVMAIGSSLTKTNFGPNMPPGKTVIHSTNDPSDINKECRADLSVVGDAALVLDALIAEVEKQKGAARGGNALASLKEEIAVGEEGVAGGMGQAPRFRRDADQPVPRDPRPDAHDGPRQRHHHPRFRQSRASSCCRSGKRPRPAPTWAGASPRSSATASASPWARSSRRRTSSAST